MLPLRHGDSYYIGRLLNGAYQIVYARNGAEGLEIAAEQMPDLILTDLMMPEMDGFWNSVVCCVRSIPRLCVRGRN